MRVLTSQRPSILARTRGSARFASSVVPGGQPTALGWRALTASGDTGARSALERALRRAARSMPAGELTHSHAPRPGRTAEHTSELQSLMRISYAVFCFEKKTNNDVK